MTKKSFVFLLEENIGRAQIKNCKQNFSLAERAKRAVAGRSESLVVLLKKCSNFVQKTPPIIILDIISRIFCMREQFSEDFSNKKIIEDSSSNQKNFELSKKGIPLVSNKEGQQVESTQYKKLYELAPAQALEIYKALKNLESGEFKNSKLRDENGELLVVWHGSPRKFDNFKTDAKGEFRWRNQGVHFSSSRKLVEQYSDKAYSALNNARYHLIMEIAGNKDFSALSKEDREKGDKMYNTIILDLIEKGENSQFYNKAYKNDNFTKGKLSDEREPNRDSIKYGKKGFSIEWFFEIFGGEMPNKNNAYFDERNRLWLGKNVGRYAYACILNIENPFELDSINMDESFELGEKSHKEKATDGTILYHPKAVHAMGGQKDEEAMGSYSAAAFNPNQIKIVGIENINKKTFQINDALI